MLQTALQLKEAIDSAASKLTRIGVNQSSLLEERFGHDYYLDFDEILTEDDINELEYYEKESYFNYFNDRHAIANYKLINEMNKLFEKKKTTYGKIEFIDHFITINDIDFSITKLTEDQVAQFYRDANRAGFGHVQTQETRIDDNIRKGREIRNFKINPLIIKTLEEQWDLNPQSVRIEPYKINLYTDGDHFQTHRDTPDKNLVGTLLLNVYDSSTAGGFYVEENIGKTLAFYKSLTIKEKGSWIGFYPDVPHGVEAIRGGYRMNIAFKVYQKGDTPIDIHIKEIEKLKSIYRQLSKSSIGLILSHDYSLNSPPGKGTDWLHIHVLDELGIKYSIIPILETWHAETNDEGDENFETMKSGIYPLTDEHLEYLIGQKAQEPIMFNKSIDFYTLGERKIWSKNEQSYAEHVGNESQPGNVDSIYLSKAIIIIN